jgi:signal peptidase I
LTPPNEDSPAPSSASGAREEPASARGSVPDPPGFNDGRIGRYVFYFVWIGAVPFALAIGSVWLLTPAPGAINPMALRVFVGEQQIPMGIVLFTVFAMTLWRFRHDLPLAAGIGLGGRKDIPPLVRPRFEDAGALLDEARRILRANRRDVERELTTSEREQLKQALDALERAMLAEKFDQAEFDAAHAKADRTVGEHLPRWRKGEMREYAESIGIAVAVALLLRAFVVEAFKIPSGSMIPTLMIGDHIFVNKFTYGPLIPWTDNRLFSRLPPERGDVMVFKFPENKEQDFIKRVIAVPGDTLEAINGRPVINGWIAPHCFVGQFKYENRAAEMYVEYLGEKSYLTLFDNDTDENKCGESAGGEQCGPGQACRGGVCGTLQGPFKVAPGEAWVMGDNRNNSHDSRSWRGGMGAGVPFENIKGRAMFVWMSFGSGGGIAQDRLFVNVLGRPKLPGGQEPALQVALDKCLRERPSIAATTPPHTAAKPGR